MLAARPKISALLFVAAMVLSTTMGRLGSAQVVATPTLQERLVFGLQARLTSEFAFIDAVVAAVEQGQIPQSLVDSTFFWARRRTPQRRGRFARRPMIYFQPALEIQLDLLDIDIGTPRLSFFSRQQF